jgi:hypothetical protein
MDMSLTTHPSTAAQAKTFVAPGSLSYPNSADLATPPGSSDQKVQDPANGVATPAATPDAQNATSGIGKLHMRRLFFASVVNPGNYSSDPSEHRCHGEPLGSSRSQDDRATRS